MPIDSNWVCPLTVWSFQTKEIHVISHFMTSVAESQGQQSITLIKDSLVQKAESYDPRLVKSGWQHCAGDDIF